jgi:hypothetical protein
MIKPPRSQRGSGNEYSNVGDRLGKECVSRSRRRGPDIAAVALANKNARVLWALITRAEEYRDPVAA